MHGSELKFGIVSDSKPGFARVYFEADDIVTDWWPVLMQTTLKDKESWPLNVKEHVACMCDARLEEGVIMGAICSNADTPDPGAGNGKFRKVFEDGTVIEYDKIQHQLTATVKGKANIIADEDITAQSATSVNITALEVKVTGNLSVSGNFAFSGTMAGAGGEIGFANGKLSVPDVEAENDVKVSGKSFISHVHGGVQSGPSLTSAPV